MFPIKQIFVSQHIQLAPYVTIWSLCGTEVLQYTVSIEEHLLRTTLGMSVKPVCEKRCNIATDKLGTVSF